MVMGIRQQEWIIFSGVQKIRLVPWYAVDPEERASALTPTMCPVENIGRFDLIDICRELNLLHGSFSRVPTHMLQVQVRRALEDETLLAVRCKQIAVGYSLAEEVEKESIPPAAMAQESHWIVLRLLDADDQPVAGARYSLKLSNGRTMTGKLDQEGQTRAEGIPPGMCSVSFPEHEDNWSKV